MLRLLAASLLLSAASAGAQPVVTSPAPEAVSVTVYRNPGRSTWSEMELEFLGGYALIPALKLPFVAPTGPDLAAWLAPACALAAVLGHVFPVWYGFRGGKGVATLVGALAGLELTLLAPLVLSWLAVIVVSGFVGLSSIVAAVAYPEESFVRAMVIVALAEPPASSLAIGGTSLPVCRLTVKVVEVPGDGDVGGSSVHPTRLRPRIRTASG
jgi:hypothetical protein